MLPSFLTTSSPLYIAVSVMRVLGSERYIALSILSADIDLLQMYRYQCIGSPVSANIKTVFGGWKKNAWTSNLKLCNHVVCPAEGGLFLIGYTCLLVQCSDVWNKACWISCLHYVSLSHIFYNHIQSIIYRPIYKILEFSYSLISASASVGR